MVKKRLSKVLAAVGVASRRKAEALIYARQVTVNGKRVLLPEHLVDEEQDEICVQGKVIQKPQAKVYFLLNKPKGMICTSLKVGGKKSVLNLFSAMQMRLFTVGRLDQNTTGLLIVTNDGAFTHQVIHPSANIDKEYLVKTREWIQPRHLLSIQEGIVIEGKRVRPCRVKKVRRGTLKIVVKEGKKREVRLLVEKAGLSLISLMRIRIGNLRLGSLKEGTWRVLKEREKQFIFE